MDCCLQGTVSSAPPPSMQALTPDSTPPQASPGNLQQLEEVVFGSRDLDTSTCVMAIRLASEGGQRSVGVAYTDACARKLGVLEFAEDDQFSNIEVSQISELISLAHLILPVHTQALLVQLSPRECLVVAHDTHSEANQLLHLLQRSNTLVTERKKGGCLHPPTMFGH